MNKILANLKKFIPTLSYFKKVAQSIIINTLSVRPVQRQNQDINRWRVALLAAEQMGQQRTQLYDIYNEVLLDGYVKRLLEKRQMYVTNKKLVFQKDGKEFEEVKKLPNGTYFYDLCRYIIEARFWGHSLIELNWSTNADQNTTTLIPRKHVKPRYKMVTTNQWDNNGYLYNELPLSKNMIEVGEEEDLGVMLQVCPLAIWKRANMGDYVEFFETFGMPTIFVSHPNEQTRNQISAALDQMGSRGRLVTEDGAKFEYHEASNSASSGEGFNVLRQALNEEIAITILGNSMTTTEAKNSGYAQSKTHAEGQNELHHDDCAFVLKVLNEKLTPYLAAIGYHTEGGLWSFEDVDTLSLTDRLNIDLKVSEKVEIDVDYWYEKYKLPKPTNPQPAKPKDPNTKDKNTEGPPNDSQKVQKKKIKV
jgi:hypothetical protein